MKVTDTNRAVAFQLRHLCHPQRSQIRKRWASAGLGSRMMWSLWNETHFMALDSLESAGAEGASSPQCPESQRLGQNFVCQEIKRVDVVAEMGRSQVSASEITTPCGSLVGLKYRGHSAFKLRHGCHSFLNSRFRRKVALPWLWGFHLLKLYLRKLMCCL